MNDNLLEILYELDHSSQSEVINDVFNRIKSFYRIRIELDAGSYFFRARLEDNPFEIVDKSEISYHPIASQVSIQRANPKGVQTFYGCTNVDFSKEDQEAALKTAILEVSKNRRNKSNLDFKEYGFVSRWRTTKKLNIMSLLYYDFNGELFRKLRDVRDEIEHIVSNKSGRPSRDLKINHWLSKIYATEFEDNSENRYNISSKFAFNFLKNHDGLLYPSVQTSGMAVNIALTKNAADTLELEYVSEIENYQRQGNTGVDFKRHSLDIENGKIRNWKNI